MAAKRARTSSTTAAPTITLRGGEAHHSSLAALWRQEKLTDIALCTEGVEFKAHRAALASSSGYFLSLFDSGMRDAASPTHAIEGLRSPVLEALLAFVYEGSCEVEEGLLTEMLDAAARLVIDPLKAACAYAIQAQLTPYNALDVWRLADLYTLPALEKAAVTSALGGFEELPPQSASGAQVLALVQEDRLVAKSEEAVFQWMVRWQEAVQPTEAELLAAMKHVRFAAMDAGFVQITVRTWPALDSKEGLGIVLDSFVGADCALPRSGWPGWVIMPMRKVDLGTFDCGACQVDFSEKAIRFFTTEGHHPHGVDEEIVLEVSALVSIDIDKFRGVMCVTGFFGYDVPDHYSPFAVADASKRVLFHFEANEGVWNGSDRADQTKSLMRLSEEIKNKTDFNPDNRDFASELRCFKWRQPNLLRGD